MLPEERDTLARSLHNLTSALNKIVVERYDEEFRATEQISDNDRVAKVLSYLKGRRSEEEKVISDFKDLCGRYIFKGHIDEKIQSRP